MYTKSTEASFDKFVETVLEWKGKGLRFHIRLVAGELKFWLSEIPDEIREEFHELYRQVIPEIRRKFSQEEKTEVAIDFNGGDLFSALQKANDDIGIDYTLMEKLNSKEKQFDMPWTWKPCEGNKVPCEIGGMCYGDFMWNAVTISKCKKQNARAIRQCPYIGQLDQWWFNKCMGIEVERKVVNGHMVTMFGDETYWEYASRRKREINEEVANAEAEREEQPSEGQEEIEWPENEVEDLENCFLRDDERVEDYEEDSIPWEYDVQTERVSIPKDFNPLLDD